MPCVCVCVCMHRSDSGDLHTGSVMVTLTETKVIDAELYVFFLSSCSAVLSDVGCFVPSLIHTCVCVCVYTCVYMMCVCVLLAIGQRIHGSDCL